VSTRRRARAISILAVVRGVDVGLSGRKKGVLVVSSRRRDAVVNRVGGWVVWVRSGAAGVAHADVGCVREVVEGFNDGRREHGQGGSLRGRRPLFFLAKTPCQSLLGPN
jgi:hypothetical protein